MSLQSERRALESIDVGAIAENRDLFQCPTCESHFADISSERIVCAAGHAFAVDKGLPLLFSPHDQYRSGDDVTDAMKAFYMENPFPDYEDFDSVADLVERSNRSVFAHALDRTIPIRTRILEVGCGTGQLSIFLSLAQRQVFGVDLCPNSLQLGRRFRDQHHADRPYFCQMNVFRPIFKPSSFDLVYCSGVLHHTGFPRRGFESICKLVKPNGYIIIGLYNRYMRIPTHVRRLLSRVVSIDRIEPVMKKLSTPKKQQTWFRDQYRNPHETDHTVGEVHQWFKANGFEYVSAIPSAQIGKTTDAILNPFRQQQWGSAWEAVLSQIVSVPVLAKEGGLFLVVGKRIDRGISQEGDARQCR